MKEKVMIVRSILNRFYSVVQHSLRAICTTLSREPKIPLEAITLIKEMAATNRLWGAERIRGELLKVGIKVAKRTVQRYMRRPGRQDPTVRPGPPSCGTIPTTSGPATSCRSRTSSSGRRKRSPIARRQSV
jgi:hypothetical protein